MLPQAQRQIVLAAAQMYLLDPQPSDRKRLPDDPMPALRVGRITACNAAVEPS